MERCCGKYQILPVNNTECSSTRGLFELQWLRHPSNILCQQLTQNISVTRTELYTHYDTEPHLHVLDELTTLGYNKENISYRFG